MKYYLAVLKKYAVFKGRASRREFWMFFLFDWIFTLVAGILDFIFKAEGFKTEGILLSYPNGFRITYSLITDLYSLALFIPFLAVVARKLHDTGKSSWWILAFALIVSSPFIYIFLPYIIPIRGEVGLEFLYPFTILGLVALVVEIWLILWLARAGDPNENAYGPTPAENV